MGLPNNYTVKPGSIPAYLDAMLNAEAPDRFTTKFLENLDFKSTNDRTIIGILKELNFLDVDGIPTTRYYKFLDRSHSEKIMAEAIRETYSDLFAVNKEAYKFTLNEVKNKLRTLYAGSKKNDVIGRIASTFIALCSWADFSTVGSQDVEDKVKEEHDEVIEEPLSREKEDMGKGPKLLNLESLQYHINIILPETRDQAVYDALFKALKEHIK